MQGKGPRHPDAAIYRALFQNLSSFEELEERIAFLPEEDNQGRAFEIFAEAFLVTQRQHEYKEVWPWGSVPLPVIEALNLPAEREKGTDGVCLNHLDGYVPYQVKFTNYPSRGLPWDELGKFFGVAKDSACDKKLVFSNRDDLSEFIRRRDKAIFVLRDPFLDLTRQELAEISAWIEGAPFQRPQPKVKRLDQEEAHAAILAGLSETDRVTCIKACGTGKTYDALWIIQALCPEKTLVFVPTLALIAQLLDDWRREGFLFKSLCVCSDQTVDKEDSGDIGADEFPFNVTHDSAYVRRWLNSAADRPKIVFSTYQSSPVIKEALVSGSFDLGIFDEAHRTAGRKASNFSLGLDNTDIDIKKRLFLTATPKHVSAIDEDSCFSMDDETVYGKEVYTLSLRGAVQLPDSPICAPKILVSIIRREEVDAELERRGIDRELIKKGEVFIDNIPITAEQVANQISLNWAVQNYGIKKAITFNGTVLSAQSFVSKGPDGVGTHLGPEFRYLHVNGEMSANRRKTIFREVERAPKVVLSNARCLTEGVNIPSVDCVALLAPWKSKISIAQAMGRALRKPKNSDKKFGYILVTAYLEEGDEEDDSKFATIIETLRWLAEEDEVFAELVREMVLERKVKGHRDSNIRNYVIFREPDLPPQVSVAELMDAIEVECLERALGDWELLWLERYTGLVAYKEANGDCNVPHSEPSGLGRWLSKQRQKKNKNVLPSGRFEKLDRLGVCWDLNAAVWEERFAQLVAYKEANGNCNVPADEIPLGPWLVTQRNMKRERTLSVDRERRLTELGVWWDVNISLWEAKFIELVTYKEANGDCNVPQGTQLGSWINTQRGLKTQNNLSPDRENRLIALDPELLLQRRMSLWDRRFAELVAYNEINGNCLVPIRTPLGGWLLTQRNLKKQGKLSEHRERQLTALDPCWHSEWEYRFAELVAYKEIHGHCDARTGPLGHWLNSQRILKNKEALLLDREKRLTALDQHILLFRRELSWENKFAELLDHKESNGNCNVPQGTSLNRWLTSQRYEAKKKRLSQDRINRLIEIGVCLDLEKAAWEDRFAELVAYKEANEGNCNPRQGTPLGNWLNSQRQLKRQEKLVPDREKRLSALGVIWNPSSQPADKEAHFRTLGIRLGNRPSYTKWEEWFAELVKYGQVTGDYNVPSQVNKVPVPLGLWLNKQRKKIKRHQLGAEKEARIRALGVRIENVNGSARVPA